MIVQLPARLARRFKDAAKAAFREYEEYAILLGRREEGNLYIEELYFPPDRAEHSSALRVELQCEWWIAAKARADEAGLVLLGDIHAHYFNGPGDTGPSEGDMNAAGYSEIFTNGKLGVFGICAVSKTKGRWWSRIRFYHAVDAPTTKIV